MNKVSQGALQTLQATIADDFSTRIAALPGGKYKSANDTVRKFEKELQEMIGTIDKVIAWAAEYKLLGE